MFVSVRAPLMEFVSIFILEEVNVLYLLVYANVMGIFAQKIHTEKTHTTFVCFSLLFVFWLFVGYVVSFVDWIEMYNINMWTDRICL